MWGITLKNRSAIIRLSTTAFPSYKPNPNAKSKRNVLLPPLLSQHCVNPPFSHAPFPMLRRYAYTLTMQGEHSTQKLPKRSVQKGNVQGIKVGYSSLFRVICHFFFFIIIYLSSSVVSAMCSK